MIGLLKVWVAAHTVQILTTVNDTMLDLKRKLAHAEKRPSPQSYQDAASGRPGDLMAFYKGICTSLGFL